MVYIFSIIFQLVNLIGSKLNKEKLSLIALFGLIVYDSCFAGLLEDVSRKITTRFSERISKPRFEVIKTGIQINHKVSDDPSTESVTSIYSSTDGIIFSVGNGLSERYENLAKQEEQSLRKALSLKEVKEKIILGYWYELARTLSFRGSEKDRCRKLATKSLMDAATIVRSKADISHFISYYHIDTVISQSIRSSKIKWEYRPKTTFSSLLEEIKYGKKKHLAIFFHADEEGNLIDYNGSKVDHSIFKLIKPNVESLIIFCCFSDKVINKYQLRTLSSPNYVGFRRLFYMETKSSDRVQGIPSLAFNYFLKEVSKTILQSKESKKTCISEKPNVAVNDIDDDQDQFCEMSIKGLDPGDNNRFQVSLNRHVVAVIENDVSQVYFPCRLINKSKRNIVIISPVENINVADSYISLECQSLDFNLFEKNRKIDRQQNYEFFSKHDDTSGFRGIKITFLTTHNKEG